jgi:hypothetical protein
VLIMQFALRFSPSEECPHHPGAIRIHYRPR